MEGAKLSFLGDELDDVRVGNRYQIVLAAQEYPDGSVYSHGTSEAFTVRSGTNEPTVSVDLSSVPSHSPFHILAFIVPEGMSLEDAADSGEGDYLAETDRVEVSSGRLSKSRSSEELGTLRQREYSRVNGEGMYAITVHGDVDFGLTVYKSAYATYNARRTVSVEDVIYESYRSGLGSTLAGIIYTAATDAGYTSAREKVNYAVKAIQAFPYVKDSVDTTPYDSYNKYPIETLCEGGGDCEDTVILLAATMLSEPYGYGCALLYLPYDAPTHVALGIKGDDSVYGSYFEQDGNRYFYTETTGEGWEIGDMPEEYEDESAEVVVL